MTSHKCKSGWVEVPIADCLVCRPEVINKAPAYIKGGYKFSTKKTIKDSNGSSETLHWSGRQDAEVRPKTHHVTAESLRPVAGKEG